VCGLDGEDEKGYKEKYGVEVDGSGLMNITFVSHYQTEGANGTNVGSRMYLLEDESHYKMFNLLNRELTFTVDTSKLPCGLNGALYFVEMEADGGVKSFPSNKAGAKYGTGYCDAQCPHDLKWIAGEANFKDWDPSSSDRNTGHGHYGTCCAELDIWEANTISTQMTVHSCDTAGYHRCEGVACGDNNGKNASDPGDRFKGVCDKNGCDYNPYREGDHKFYGPGSGFTLDSTRPMRVVTQFITDDGTDNGNLKEMRRFYIQDNKTFYNPTPSYGPGPHGETYNSLSDDMCAVQMNNFTDRLDVFQKKGGIKGMGEAMRRSMALVFSLWDDHDVGMIWLDATDPYPIPPNKWGAPRGTCDQTSGNYTQVEKDHGDAYVLFSDVRYGEIGTTYGPGATPPKPLCPGGSKDACIATCDPSDPAKYLTCIKTCDQHCPPGSLAPAIDGENLIV
jgi:cellulose 1,4-beta-cellobiosidase